MKVRGRLLAVLNGDARDPGGVSQHPGANAIRPGRHTGDGIPAAGAGPAGESGPDDRDGRVRERRSGGRVSDGSGNRARLLVAPASGPVGVGDEQNLTGGVEGLRDARPLQQGVQRRSDADRVELHGHRPVERHDAARERDAHTGLPGDGVERVLQRHAIERQGHRPVEG